MSKSIKVIKFISIIGGCFVVGIIALIFSGALQKVNLPPSIRRTVLYIHQPPGYYDNIVELSVGNTQFEMKPLAQAMKVAYPGRYFVQLKSTRFKAKDYNYYLHDKSKFDMKLRVDIVDKEKVIFSRFIQSDYSPFLTSKDGGMNLMYFQSPVDIPLQKSVTCKIEIQSLNGDFIAAYAPLQIVVVKSSDE